MRHPHAPAMFTIMVALTGALAAQAVPEVKLPPSPMGQAAVQLGGRWEKTAERRALSRRQVAGRRLRPAAAARPHRHLRQRRRLRQAGQPRCDDLADGRQRHHHAHHAGAAADRRRHPPARRLQPVRRSQGHGLDAGRQHPAASAEVRPQRQGAALRRLQLRRQVRRAAGADDRADHRHLGRAADDWLRERHRRPAPR